MFSTKIKVCGITRVEDGLAALEAGADMLGFIRAPSSPRWRSLGECSDVLLDLRLKAGREFQAVGVYVNAPLNLIGKEVERCGFDRVQLHGHEDLPFARQIPVPVIKAIKIAGPESIAQAEDFPGIDLLTDAWHPTLDGGTGEAYDYSLLKELAGRRRVLVAGGLTPANAGEMIEMLRPWGVDVSSGVEVSPGVKDPDLIREFIANVKNAEK